MEWSTEWPTTPGWYWFFGYGFDVEQETKPRLYSVKVVKTGSGVARLLDGHFMYKSEQGPGAFMPMVVPEPPALEVLK